MIPPADLERATLRRIEAGATRVAWVCEKGREGTVACRLEPPSGTAVGFGDGKAGARLPTGAKTAPSRRAVGVTPAASLPNEDVLAEIGRALAVDPASPTALARWRSVVEREARAGREAARLVPRILDAALARREEDGARSGRAGEPPNRAGAGQLTQLQLQQALQRRQETFQMMSNIQKTLHDTEMAIIRNMKG
ncbi:MAG TPA: hypothetical protein VKB18_05875 [Gemmatimonadota bacterium]|nr:hypothetical protein [Gemmatimonadota bacterium]